MPDHLEELRIDGEIRKSAASSDPFAAAVRATRMPTLITDPRQPDNPIVFVNDAFHRLTGFARGECLGRNCRFLQGPETDAATVARIREAIDRREAIETEILNYRKDGSTFWNRVLVSPVFDDGGELVFFFASQFDVTHERERLAAVTRARDELETKIESRLADLKESEERLRFILKSGRFGFWTLDLQTFELVSSETCRRTFGRGESDPFTFDDLAAAIHPGDVDRWREAMREATLKPEGEFGIEYRIATPDGSQRWVEIRGQVKRDADGTPRSMAGVSLDISDRRRADEHRELLAGELAHRVKNTLANVQSIIGQTLQNAPSLEEGRRVLTGRVAALAAAHEILLREEWKAVDLHDLLAVVLEPFGGTAGGRIVVEGPSLLLRPRVATSFSLALHELATNASKYGALSVAAGTVGIRWEIGEGPEATFRLSWRERGGPVVVPSERKGFGSRVLTRALPQELDGQAALRPLPDGIAFDVEAPLHALQQG